MTELSYVGKPSGGRRTVVVVLLGLALAACAGPKPVMPPLTQAPMVAPVPPPPSPEFNVRIAQPLPVPSPPALLPMPVPPVPPPTVALTPLPAPEPLTLSALPPVSEPAPAPQRAAPMPRPPEPAAQASSQPPAGAEPPSRAMASLPMGGSPSTAAPAGAAPPAWRLVFAGPGLESPAEAPAVLRAVATRMRAEPLLRLKLNSYASGAADDPIPARKLSLQRALKVRSLLAEQGIGSNRVDVLALGLTADGPPTDRIDLVPIE